MYKAPKKAIKIKFQFLMVRLKEKATVKKGKNITKFQFLMVRLKVFRHCTHTRKNLNFNSLWCD